MNDVHFETSRDVTEVTREAVYDQLRSFNRAANPDLWAKYDDAAHEAIPLSVIAYGKNGAVAGGLFGETQFSWFKLSIMAVRAELRRQGLGRALVERAEAEARRRGCKYVFLDTMSYQAPGFYESLGYQVVGRIEDWDSHGHTKYFFTKGL